MKTNPDKGSFFLISRENDTQVVVITLVLMQERHYNKVRTSIHSHYRGDFHAASISSSLLVGSIHCRTSGRRQQCTFGFLVNGEFGRFDV